MNERTSSPHRLDPLLAPRSIAFIGASTRPDTPGNVMVRMPQLAGFRGRLYPVNPRYATVENLTCYPSLAALPETVDHVVLGVSSIRLEAALAEAIAHGARAVTVFASGLVENDSQPPLPQRLASQARAAGIEMVGGNCMGFYNLIEALRVVAFGSPLDMQPGPITLIAQSGSVFGALSHNDRRLKFNFSISSGSEWVTTAANYLDWALEQATTRVVGLFLETIRDHPGFVAGLEKAVCYSIPVVILKVGRTPESAAMARSHTGALAGSDAAYEALFERYGVIRVESEDELAATLLLLSHPKRPKAGGLAAMHDSSGEREMMVDLNAGIGAPLARISQQTAKDLEAYLDPGLAPVNPLDAWGTGHNPENSFAMLMGILLKDPDVALGVLFADIRDGYYLSECYTRAMLRAAEQTDKPVAIATNYSLVRHEVISLRATDAGIPVLDGTEEALMAVRHALAYRDFLARQDARETSPVDRRTCEHWLARIAAGPLCEAEALDLLDEWGIATVPRRLAECRASTVSAAEELGYPVVLKTAEPGITHKTEVGGVRLDLRDATAVATAYDSLAARLGRRVLVQRMARIGIEAGLGSVNDADIGPYVVAAAGGVLIELLEDQVVALAPVTLTRASELVSRLRLVRLLKGVRGMPACDIGGLVEALRRLSHLAFDLREGLAEIDINPVIVTPDGCVAVDALIVRKADQTRASGERRWTSP
jgi:acetate---CoA ligase (ADP-forming)